MFYDTNIFSGSVVRSGHGIDNQNAKSIEKGQLNVFMTERYI